MSVESYLKDPDAVLDFGFDWTNWLVTAETIVTSTWTVDTGITENINAKTTVKTSIWLSGGTVGTTYHATNKIVTNQGRTDERTLSIRVRNR